MLPIRCLTSSDAAMFRTIRLAALEFSSEAFATPLEAEAARPRSGDLLRETAVFAAERLRQAFGRGF
jgi:hypothetical protein